MSSLEIVSPTVVDGIEFYVSNDGKKCGVSQVGLARLCGINEAPMRRLLTSLKDSGARPSSTQKLLEDLASKDLYLDLAASKQAKVIDSKVAARIIRYYAFEAINQTDTAKFSLGKFAEIGVDTWIKEIVGYSSNPDQSQLQASINQVIEMLGDMWSDTNKRLKVIEEQTFGYRKVSVEMPGLREWMESIPDEVESEQCLLEGDADELYTLAEYIRMEKRLTFDKPLMAKFSNQVSYVYRTMSLKIPGKKRTQSAQGYKSPAANAYKRTDFPLLDIAFKQTMMSV